MSYTNYLDTVRCNLCLILTELRNNEKKIRKIHERIENIEFINLAAWPVEVKLVEAELRIEVEFYETLNDSYDAEVSRLIAIIFEKSTEI